MTKISAANTQKRPTRTINGRKKISCNLLCLLISLFCPYGMVPISGKSKNNNYIQKVSTFPENVFASGGNHRQNERNILQRCVPVFIV
jgi:hypothetical protein